MELYIKTLVNNPMYSTSEDIYNAGKDGNIVNMKQILKTYEQIHNSNASLNASINASLWFRGLEGLCEGNHTDILVGCINELPSKNNKNNKDAKLWRKFWHTCLSIACKSNNIIMISFIISHKSYNNRWSFDCYTHGPGPDIAYKQYSPGRCWNKCMIYACYEGLSEIVNYVVTKGATEFDAGFISACQGKHAEIAKYMISKGLNDINLCLCCSLIHRLFDVAKLVINTYVFDVNSALRLICCKKDDDDNINNYLEIAELLLTKGVVNWDGGLWMMYMEEMIADIENNMIMARFFLKHGTNSIPTKMLTKMLQYSICSDFAADISIILIMNGADVRDPEVAKNLACTKNFKLYCLFCKKAKITINARKYYNLLIKYPPYVLLIAAKTKYTCMNKLPTELFRLLFEY